MNNNLHTLFGSTAETLKQIEDLHIDLLVFDRSAESQELSYWAHVQAVIDQAGDRLVPAQATRVDAVSGPTRPITVYRVAHHRPGPAEQRLRVTTVTTDEITRPDFERQIQAPIADWLQRHQAQDRILYIVLTKGMPLRITGTIGRSGTIASVDSELTLLYRRMTGAFVL